MQKNGTIYNAYLEILRQELVPAVGCTEPIALAYAAAKAREVLGEPPHKVVKVVVAVSGNLIKNTKSVVVPNTNGLCGIDAAIAAGIVAGEAGNDLQVLSGVTETQKADISDFVQKGIIEVVPADSDLVFDLSVSAFSADSSAKVRIVNSHSNIVLIEKDGQILQQWEFEEETRDILDEEKKLLSVENILEFAKTCDVGDVADFLDRQIAYNTAIGKEGLENSWGANIGSVYLKYAGQDGVHAQAIAMAAAGSDARMSGCELPVVINSGSGNQGITVSVPVIEYAKGIGASKEQLYRALLISNLIGIHIKSGMGRLSAYCGVVSAACASCAAIAYLCGEDDAVIRHALVNGLAIDSGIVCDGAKPSCAGKIVVALESAMLGYRMAKEGEQFRHGEGIVKKGIENTISSVGRLGKKGMGQTDKEILAIMLDRNL